MPSSFEGKYGSTRYWLRGELSRFKPSHRERADKTKKTITFINPLNVSLAEYQVSSSSLSQLIFIQNGEAGTVRSKLLPISTCVM